ncbi:MAG: NADH-quinone oxidoreductase subunit L [Candidatus Muproteobacteria bacterium RIFCSPHIGHO2_02_FULL_65_16]|uniref:NADH-quinone oxidoreductase subunit L n=1 Tax=Candidatus Muproteobacteria bacterium RIFCSPHIGHO2_02_FULL_65_16 TaxID=1817766 RepID=A0A1F6U3P1_9PROT|nr:MAG: NADH-quinone oxidoreductase subunit L [Candidatus Muproteobacteria bacterium RIFCSPHIGHO2_02_FULL_65_16]
MKTVYLLIPLSCLAGALIAGLLGWKIGRAASHTAAILGVAGAFVLSAFVVLPDVLAGHTYDGAVYTWGVSGGVPLEIGFLIDPLSALMMTVVTFVSLMVHIYTVGYMRDDPGYQRFFSYIALFTFSMLMLVMANNFLQLFFGWEAVGLMSYLLIGFWFTRASATHAQLKAFIVNRVGDFGFILGVAAVYLYFGTLDYTPVFAIAPQLAGKTAQIIPGVDWSVLTLVCILLFIGAMGKSAQVPLHVWLPDSMEGPTPISALIHAATMVTAGVFMVARMSPLYELSETALSVVLVIGAITALFMAFVGIVQNDIKRVVAYSTLSQLGYMMVALGASAYAAGIFHLMTHAFFKALLFLAAGSVIIALHHEQDMRKMGGLKDYMPWTFLTAWAGSLALVGIPPFAGFFSKDMIIEAVHASQLPGSGFAYVAVLSGVFVTALYTFRMLFMTFYGKPRMDEHARSHLKESPWVVTVPLVLLALPSVVIGFLTVEPLLFGGYFGTALKVLPGHDVLARLGQDYHGWGPFVAHGLQSAPFLLAVGGIGLAWLLYYRYPQLPEELSRKFRLPYTILVRKYGFDEFNDTVFAAGARRFGGLLWRIGDVKLIDGLAVNGTARVIGWVATVARHVQSGYVYHYAFAMILGLFLLITVFLYR